MSRLKSVKLYTVPVNSVSNCALLGFIDSEGMEVFVEINSNEDTHKVLGVLRDYLSKFKDISNLKEDEVVSKLNLTNEELMKDFFAAQAISAFRNMLTLIHSIQSNISIGEFLGKDRGVREIPLYANLNKALKATDRSLDDYQRIIALAIKHGFRVIKIAPFDEVEFTDKVDEQIAKAKLGIKRIKEIRKIFGNDIEIIVDCHNRFVAKSFDYLVKAFGEFNLKWLEEPYELDKPYPFPFYIAGGERGYGEKYFQKISNYYDIVMFDIKYCGGMLEAVRIGKELEKLGKKVSLHNPSGPLSLLMSGLVTASLSNSIVLEFPLAENDWRSKVLIPPENIKDGYLHLPNGAGLGATLDKSFLRSRGATTERVI